MIDFPLRRATNVHQQAITVSKAERSRLMHHKPAVLWFTGLSGAGKSTIANLVEAELHTRGVHTLMLDGDNVRHGLNRDLGFTAVDRVENIRRVGEVAKLMMEAGTCCPLLVHFAIPSRTADGAGSVPVTVRVFIGKILAAIHKRFYEAVTHVSDALAQSWPPVASSDPPRVIAPTQHGPFPVSQPYRIAGKRKRETSPSVPVLPSATAATPPAAETRSRCSPKPSPRSRRRSLAQPGERRAAKVSGVNLPCGPEPLIGSSTNTRSNAPPVTPDEPKGKVPILCLSCGANRNFSMVSISGESARK